MTETQLLLNYSPVEAHAIILRMQETLSKHNVQLHITAEEQVKLAGEDLGCSGYFDSSGPLFAVALGKPFIEWFRVYLHEYSHFEQWLDDPNYFQAVDKEVTDLFAWIEHKTELSPERLKTCIEAAIFIEYDCEKRVLEKIESQHLEHLVCPQEYAQLANAYFNFYLYMAESRKWYTAKNEPYSLKEVYSLFPKTLVQLKELTPELRQAYSLCV